jgi:hypothetical protein
MTDRDDNPFSRWSRRKLRAAEERETKEVQAPDPVAEPETEEDEAELLERLQLPVPERMKEGDDFSVFMKAGVPEFLRRRALRVLWRSNPVLANLDGLNDYDDDFTSPELTQKVLATGYKVGRGFLRQEPVADDQEDPDESELESVESTEESAETIVSEAPFAKDIRSNEGTPDEETSELSFRPKRMRFQT